MKLASIMLVLALAPWASAATVWDNGAPDLADASLSDVDASVVTFDDFTLSGSATIRSIQWWGIYIFTASPGPDSFNINIFADNGGAPGTSVTGTLAVSASRLSTTDLVFGSFPLFEYTANIPDTVLSAGTYWLSIQNDTTGSGYDWSWASSANTPANALFLDGSFTAQEFDLAFNLNDTAVVPEPSTMLLSAVGLGGILLARRRRA